MTFTITKRTVVIILVVIAALVVIGLLNTGIIGGESSNTGGEGPVVPTLVVPR